MILVDYVLRRSRTSPTGHGWTHSRRPPRLETTASVAHRSLTLNLVQQFGAGQTNYYTYMATKTQSELAVRGHNKSGKHHLRQVGLGLLLDRASALPLYYTTYPGNLHDSALFHRVIDEVFGAVMGFAEGGRELTVVFDKGMNSKDNLALIDSRQQIHFITTYSTYFAEDLARLSTKYFDPLDIAKNRQLLDEGKGADRLCAFRTTETLWGRERTVVVTFNPATMRKKLYDHTRKLERLRAELMEYRRKYNHKERNWQSAKAVVARYRKLCDQLYVSRKCFKLPVIISSREKML